MSSLAIHNPFNAPVYYEETVSSTMNIARNLAAQGEQHGTVIAAGFQEAGRGRGQNRSWGMERGKNLPFTILLRYGPIGAIPPALTLRAGLAVAIAIEDFAPVLTDRVLVKWPNDIIIDGKKAAGILAEADGGTVFIGIGINIMQQEFPSALQDKAVSIAAAAGREIAGKARFDLLEKILARLHYELESCGDTWQKRMEQRLYKKGETVCFAPGAVDCGKILEGTLFGIGAHGELLIMPTGETTPQAFITGELRVY